MKVNLAIKQKLASQRQTEKAQQNLQSSYSPQEDQPQQSHNWKCLQHKPVSTITKNLHRK